MSAALIPKPPWATAERFRASIKCGEKTVTIQVERHMTVGRACEAIIRAANLSNPDRHALIATWRRAPHMIVQGCTLRPSDVLGERMSELPSCDGNIVLHYHDTHRPFHISSTDAAPDKPTRALQLYRLGTMVTFGSLYKLSSRDPSRLVWRRSYCVLQESALLCYCGWSKGWKQYPLSVAVVCRVDVGTYVGLAGLPYRLAIAHTVFELALPEKSLLFHAKDAVSCEKWYNSILHAVTNAADNNSIMLAECVVADKVSKAAARCDDTISLLYTCDTLSFLCHAACASNFMTYLRGKASVTPDLLELAVDCLALHRRITGLIEASVRTDCAACMDQLMNITRGLWRAVTPLTESAFPTRQPPTAHASATVIEYLSEAAAVFELAWTRSVTILSEHMIAYRRSRQFKNLLQYLARSEDTLAELVSCKPLLTGAVSPQSRFMWYEQAARGATTCDRCAQGTPPAADSFDAALQEVVDLPSAKMLQIAEAAGWLDSFEFR